MGLTCALSLVNNKWYDTMKAILNQILPYIHLQADTKQSYNLLYKLRFRHSSKCLAWKVPLRHIHHYLGQNFANLIKVRSLFCLLAKIKCNQSQGRIICTWLCTRPIIKNLSLRHYPTGFFHPSDTRAELPVCSF